MAVIKVLGEPLLLPMLVILGIVWLVPHTPLPSQVHYHLSQRLPKLKVDLHPNATFLSRYSSNKTALYIETRANVHHITPLLLHMMEVVPPEWRFLFLGSFETAATVTTSSPVRRYQELGKLKVGTVNAWTQAWGGADIEVDELHNRLLTNGTFYDKELRGVESLFVFHSDSVLCANSASDLNDWLEYDWVGAPWHLDDRFGGNGGLSLRRVSRVQEILQFQKRLDDSASEDQWLASRIGLIRGVNMAPPAKAKDFAVEDIWSDRPMGYHINPGMGPGNSADVWDWPEKRRTIYEYCPEIKIILDMRLERERCQPAMSPEQGDG